MLHIGRFLTTVLILTTSTVLCDIYRHTSLYNLMKCAYGERGSLTATCINATANFFKNTPYRFDQLDETLICLNCTLPIIDTGTFDISGNQIKSLDLRYSSIESINQKGFIGLVFLENLDLSHNKIRSIFPGTFTGVKKIKTLKLSDNLINILSENGFFELVNLQKLVLANNSIKTLDAKAFNGLVSLEELDLGNNEIGDIKDVFGNLTSLKILNLQNNRISTLTGTEFFNLTSLLVLNLSQNNIPTVNIVFLPQNTLKSLNLARNMLNTLTSDSFRGLYKLEILDLSFNNIYDISRKALLHMFNLHDLNLAYNNLTVLETGTYSGLPQLRYLNCSHNAIENIIFNGVFALNSLHTLDLSHNSLSDLDYTALVSRLPRLSYIRLEDNPLPCDLESEMELYFSEDNFKFVLYDNNLGAVICVEKPPREHAYEALQDKIQDQKTSGASATDIWIFVLIGLIMVAISVLFYLQFRSYQELRFNSLHRATSSVHLITAE